MKKIFTIILIVLSSVIILDGFNVWHAVAMFYVAGEIPGTHASVNPVTMMGVFALLTGFVIARIGNRFVLSLFDCILSRYTHQRA